MLPFLLPTHKEGTQAGADLEAAYWAKRRAADTRDRLIARRAFVLCLWDHSFTRRMDFGAAG